MPRTPEVCPTAFCPPSHFSKNTSRMSRVLRPADCRLPTAVRLLQSALCLLLLLVTHHASLITVHAQGATATLSGAVTDQNDAVIPDVSIEVINIARGFQRSATTNGEGTFVVPLLPPGNYTVKAEHNGFTPTEVRDVVLNVNDQVAIKIHLSVGTLSQTVQIVEGSLINESPSVGTVVDRQFVENLPLNGRSFQSLITLTPGIVLTKASQSEQGQFSVNGQRASANYVTVDGVSANVGVPVGGSLGQSGGGALPALSAAGGTNSLVSVDAMQEFKIQTSTFAPEFGRTPGGQISIATRTGTNEFRGTVFEYFRNDKLDANDWFANANRLPKPALRQNDFGGVLGGPLYLPRFGEGGPTFYRGKDRTFFFLSYEGLRLRQPQTAVTLVPSTASRQAAVPQTRPLLNAYPIPNGSVFANAFAEFAATYSDPSTLNSASIRLDHTFNHNLVVFGRYSYSTSDTTQRGASGRSLNSLTMTRFKIQTLTLGMTHSLTPMVSNETRANYSASDGGSDFRLDSFGGAILPDNSVLFPSFASPQNSLFLLSITGGRALWSGLNVENTQRQINVLDNLSVITGAHQLKFGVDYRRLLPLSRPREYEQLYFFSGLTGATGAISGNAQVVQVGARDTVALSFDNFSAYGQDSWKATPRLTLTYGLRWDVNPAPRGRNGKEIFTFENLENPAALRLAPEGTPLYETTYNNFAPRFGVAYQLSQRRGRETVLRGGIGIFYDLGSGSVANAASAFPYARIKNLVSVPFPLTMAQAAPLPLSLNIPATGQAVVAARHLKLPRTYQWNMTFEQSLGNGQAFTASYVAAVGRRLLRQEAFVFPPSFSVGIVKNTATSDYHALQLQFQRRLTRGLQALASYTWSHSIDIASIDSSSGTGTFSNPRLDRGSSDFDVRHAFNAAVTYNIPIPDMGNVGNAILGNWSVDTVFTARTALPVDIIAATNPITRTFVRPNVIPGIPLYIVDPNIAGGRRFNRAAFVAPLAGSQGTFGRNVLRGFPVFQVDLALRRQFNLSERTNLQLKAEFFNLFNHPNFGDPGNFEGNFLPSSLFGLSTSMLGRSLGTGGTNGGFNPLYQIGGSRSTQLSLRLNF
jgi:hypothetical protein